MAEFAVIVMGVLVALAVDEWQDARQDRSLELEYAARLRADLQADTLRLNRFARGPLGTKAEVLRLLQSETDPLSADRTPSEFLGALERSTYWGLPETRDAVFRELESTGRLGLLGEPDLRSDLAAYYAFSGLLYDLLAEPFGDYRRILTETFSGDLQHRWRVESLPIDEAEVRAEVRKLRAHPDLAGAINAELHYLSFMVSFMAQQTGRAEQLIESLLQQYPA